MNSRHVLLTAVAVILPLSARAAEKPVPETAALLDRVVRANSRPGPTTITSTHVQRRPDRPEMTIQSTIQWNDENHFRVTSTGAGNTMLGIANGASRLLYTSADNAYERNGKRFGMVTPMLQAALGYIAPELANPKTRAVFAKGVVTPTTLSGERVYRIFVQPRPNDKKAFIALLVNESDLLIRKFVLNVNDERSDTMTFSYRKEAAPFPASAFAFTPPPGARDATALVPPQ